MPYTYTGPIPPVPTAQTPAGDAAWTNWFNYETAKYRERDVALREAHEETHAKCQVTAEKHATAIALLAENSGKPQEFVKRTLNERINSLAENIKSENPTMTDTQIIQAVEQFYRRLSFVFPI